LNRTRKLTVALLAAAALVATAPATALASPPPAHSKPAPPPAPPGPPGKNLPNVFARAGHSPRAVDAKIRSAWQQLFHGAPGTAPTYADGQSIY
jgi:oligosaccharide reducing-end xylanase